MVRAHLDAKRGATAIHALHPEFSLSTLKKLIPKLKRGLEPGFKGRRRKITAEASGRIEELAGGGASLATIAHKIHSEFTIKLCRTAISKQLALLKNRPFLCLSYPSPRGGNQRRGRADEHDRLGGDGQVPPRLVVFSG